MPFDIVPRGFVTLGEAMRRFNFTQSQIAYGVRLGVVVFVKLEDGSHRYSPDSLLRLAGTRRMSVRPRLLQTSPSNKVIAK